MARSKEATLERFDAVRDYRLVEQIGHILRRASQRHSQIFSAGMPAGLTPTRFAALAMLLERGPLSQNELGRLTAMDVATIKGVVDRLRAKELVSVGQDPDDARRNLIALTPAGEALLGDAIPAGVEVSAQTMEPLDALEQRQLIALLRKIT